MRVVLWCLASFYLLAYLNDLNIFLGTCEDGETLQNLSVRNTLFLGSGIVCSLNICVRADMTLTRNTAATDSLPYYKLETYLVRNMK